MAKINQRYCIENQGGYVGYGEDCWGLTASDFAWNYQAQEPMPHRDNGTMAPTGALASFPYTPAASMIENYRTNLLWNLFMSHPDVQKGIQKIQSIK